jgi:2,4-didehydro-3-deoxy-L-rhamnonate hydrolase
MGSGAAASPLAGFGGRLERRMRLVRIGARGDERPGVLAGDSDYVDLSDVVRDFDCEFFEADGIGRIRSVVASRIAAGETRSLGKSRLGSPIARPHQIVCVGLNYRDHAIETGQAVPKEPILFTKAPNTMIGPNDDVLIPRAATKTDWEVELGVVIGRRASYLRDASAARAHVAGWVLVNDVSERAFQMERGGQWLKGKSAETFNPTGPWLATVEDINDVNDLELWLDVNGIRRQRGSTSTMVFDPFEIVRYISQFMVLEPGDLINTGTPPGVGMGFDPPVWLAPGDIMTLGIDGLGAQRQRVLPPREV